MREYTLNTFIHSLIPRLILMDLGAKGLEREEREIQKERKENEMRDDHERRDDDETELCIMRSSQREREGGPCFFLFFEFWSFTFLSLFQQLIISARRVKEERTEERNSLSLSLKGNTDEREGSMTREKRDPSLSNGMRRGKRESVCSWKEISQPACLTVSEPERKYQRERERPAAVTNIQLSHWNDHHRSVYHRRTSSVTGHPVHSRVII